MMANVDILQLPPFIYNTHILVYLTLQEIATFLETSKQILNLIQYNCTIQTPVDINCSPSDLLQRLRAHWKLILRNISYQPKVDQDNQEDHLKFVCPEYVQDLILNCTIRQLNLSGIDHVELFEGIHTLNKLDLTGCITIDGLDHLKHHSLPNFIDLSYCPNISDLGFLLTDQPKQATEYQVRPEKRAIDASYCHGITNVAALAHFTSVQLNVCRSLIEVSPLSNVFELSLRNCPLLTDVSALRNVKILNLGGCIGISDVSSLSNVCELTLSGCVSVEDVSTLKNVKILNLSKCLNVRDVSGLMEVTHLDLSGCVNIVPATMAQLYNATSLNLSGCKQIQDKHLAMFRHVQSLNLRMCSKLTTVAFLYPNSQLHTLDVSNCKFLAGINVLHQFPSLRNLYLSRCSQLTNLNGVPTTLETLDVSYCGEIDSLANVEHVRKLNAYRCVKLINISSLKHVREVNFAGCTSLYDVSTLSSSTVVDLRFCNALSDLRPLMRVRILKLGGCRQLKDQHVSVLSDVIHLDLSYCPLLEDVGGLYCTLKCKSLSLAYCERVKTVSGLGHVRNLNLAGCSLLDDVTALQNVHTLNLSDCKKLRDVSRLTGVRVLDLRYNLNRNPYYHEGFRHGVRDHNTIESNGELEICKAGQATGQLIGLDVLRSVVPVLYV